MGACPVLCHWCGGAIERKPRKSAPDQRQRKEKDSVLPKESEQLLRHGNDKILPAPSKGYTGDYPLCVLLVTFRTNEKSPQRSVRRTHQNHRRFFGEFGKAFIKGSAFEMVWMARQGLHINIF